MKQVVIFVVGFKWTKVVEKEIERFKKLETNVPTRTDKIISIENL